MAEVGIRDAKMHRSPLLRRAAMGEEIVITNRVPVARLVRIPMKNARRGLGIFTGRFKVPDNFDASLPDDLLVAFEGKPVKL